MTVKCLSDQQKARLIHDYTIMKLSIKTLAPTYNVSQRTVVRVLQECRVYTPKVRKAKQPEVLPELTLIEKTKCLFKAIFFKKPKPLNAQSLR